MSVFVDSFIMPDCDIVGVAECFIMPTVTLSVLLNVL